MASGARRRRPQSPGTAKPAVAKTNYQPIHSQLFANAQSPLRAGSRHTDPDFELLAWAEADGIPRLSGCLAAIACRVEHLLDGGDHWIVIGDVTTMYRDESDRTPLLYFSGSYGAP